MHADYYQNILYPLQNKVLKVFAEVDTSFYLTGGTALSRAYLNHRYSEDLDFFVNDDSLFKKQVDLVINHLTASGYTAEIATTLKTFTRVFIVEENCSLKVDFVNDISTRFGQINATDLCIRTDSVQNILSNKLTALSRLEAKDVIDLIYISRNYEFNWEQAINEAQQKDMWVNPVEIATLLEQFPLKKRKEIAWVSDIPNSSNLKSWLHTMISDVMIGKDNSLYSQIK